MVIILILAVGVFCYFAWRHHATALTRNCRWRQQRSEGCWRCSFCGAVEPGDVQPRICRDPRKG
ncbi:hypothetical protein ACUXV3_09925 [Roseobacteraceae bacterium NS-SX3]